MRGFGAVCVAFFSLTFLLEAGGRAQSGGREPVKRALLVGINLYQPAGTKAQHMTGCQGGRCELREFPNLNGPVNDVAAMRDLLSSPKFGFDPKNITVLTNPGLPATGPTASQLDFVKLDATQTKHDELIATMRKYLVDQPNKGDTVIFFYAGHGSLRVNSKGTKLAMMVDGKPSHADSTIVPSDAWTGVHDIRDRETTRIFNDALDKGIKLTVILDSCHSGSFTRGVELGTHYAERSLSYDPADVNEGPELLQNGEPKPYPSERADNPALVFSAAQQDQTAKERMFGDTPATASAHGAFTIALIKALQSLPPNASASVVYQQVRASMEGEGVGDQTPALDASKDRRNQPLFGGEASDSGKTRAAAIGMGDDGEVLLDAGQLSGIDVGSEFTSITADERGRQIKVRVESLQGLTQARAKIVLPVGAKVKVSQVFELTKWVPREVDTLHFWSWPSNLSQASVQAAADQVKASGFKTVEDPVEMPWSDMLAWNGTQWELRHVAVTVDTPIGPTLTVDALQKARKQYATFCVTETLSDDEKQLVDSVQDAGLSSKMRLDECGTFLYKQNGWVIHHVEKATVQPLGATLTAAALKAHLAANAKLWANLPPPQELYDKLALHEEHSLVVEVKDIADADYILAGSLTGDGPQWAWFHKPEYMISPRAAVTRDHSPGCSTTSKYPVASDWVLLPDPASLADTSAALNKYSSLLAKTNGWLNLSSNLSGASSLAYYGLVFKRVGETTEIPSDQPVKQDDRLQMYLRSAGRISESRWVYVLDIDCHGRGSVLFPRDTSDNRFPNNAATPHDDDLELTGAPKLRIGPPYGVDTIMFISTQQPLPDPSALEFEGVGTREVRTASRGAPNPFQQLLSNTSAGTRGPLPEMPTGWSIDAFSLQSVPK